MIPPHPQALAKAPLPLRWWFMARHNSLAGWSEDMYHRRLQHWRLPRHDVLVVNDRALVRQVLVSEVQHFPKSLIMRRMAEPLLGKSIFTSQSPLWRERRRRLAPLFHHQRLPAFAAIVESVVTELLQDWQTLPDGAVVELHQAMTRVTASVAWRAFLARQLGDRAGEAHEIFRDYQHLRGRLALADLLRLPSLDPWRGRRTAQRLRRLVAELPAAPPGECPSLAALLGDDTSAEAQLDEAMTLFLAGHETTASTLAWALYLLAREPQHAQRVREEALDTATPEALAQCYHTRAVVAETLRLYPPIPLVSRELTAPYRLGGIALRRGSVVAIAPWLLHRHRGYWESPDAFCPERFQPEGPITRLPAAPQEYIFLPFGAGQRVCPGIGFALLEATLVLNRLLAHYRFEVVEDAPVEPVAQLTLTPRGGLPLRLWRR